MTKARPPGSRKSLVTIAVIAALGIGAAALAFFGRTAQEPPADAMANAAGQAAPATAPAVDVVVPAKFTALASDGRILFEQTCAVCHGANAAGTGKGPPLVHDLYNPGHHDDESFVRAAAQGVRSHHWPFGDMPPQSHVTEPQARAIARYVRELQEANGIQPRPHRM